jgi:hypothetical protein
LWWGLIEVLAADTSVSATLAVSGDESCATQTARTSFGVVRWKQHNATRSA